MSELKQALETLQRKAQTLRATQRRQRPSRRKTPQFKSKREYELYRAKQRGYRKAYKKYKSVHQKYQRYVEKIKGRGGYVVLGRIGRRRHDGEWILRPRGQEYTRYGFHIRRVSSDWFTRAPKGSYKELEEVFGAFRGKNIFLTESFYRKRKPQIERYIREHPGMHPELREELRIKGEAVDFGRKFNRELRRVKAMRQDILKQRFLESTTATWASKQAYQRAFKGVYGRLPVASEVVFRKTPIAAKQLEARVRMIESPTAVWKSPKIPALEAAKLEHIYGKKVKLPEQIWVKLP